MSGNEESRDCAVVQGFLVCQHIIWRPLIAVYIALGHQALTMLLFHNAPSLSGSLNVENVPERMLSKKLCLERLVLRQIQCRFSASAGAPSQSQTLSSFEYHLVI